MDDSFSTFMEVFLSYTHMQSVFSLTVHSKLKGYLNQLMKGKIPIAIFIDFLDIPSRLSLVQQKKEAVTVNAAINLEKTSKRFDLLERKDYDKLPHVKHLLFKIATINSNF